VTKGIGMGDWRKHFRGPFGGWAHPDSKGGRSCAGPSSLVLKVPNSLRHYYEDRHLDLFAGLAHVDSKLVESSFMPRVCFQRRLP
jgi:hypothetical protein